MSEDSRNPVSVTDENLTGRDTKKDLNFQKSLINREEMGNDYSIFSDTEDSLISSSGNNTNSLDDKHTHQEYFKVYSQNQRPRAPTDSSGERAAANKEALNQFRTDLMSERTKGRKLEGVDFTK
jgi:hypothetical protein